MIRALVVDEIQGSLTLFCLSPLILRADEQVRRAYLWYSLPACWCMELQFAFYPQSCCTLLYQWRVLLPVAVNPRRFTAKAVRTLFSKYFSLSGTNSCFHYEWICQLFSWWMNCLFGLWSWKVIKNALNNFPKFKCTLNYSKHSYLFHQPANTENIWNVFAHEVNKALII